MPSIRQNWLAGSTNLQMQRCGSVGRGRDERAASVTKTVILQEKDKAWPEAIFSSAEQMGSFCELADPAG